MVVGGKWAQVLCTPPDRKVVGAGPVGSGHGSYQLVSWWGGQCWCPPMAHAQWWQPGERDPRRRDVGAAWHEESVSPNQTDSSCHDARVGQTHLAMCAIRAGAIRLDLNRRGVKRGVHRLFCKDGEL